MEVGRPWEVWYSLPIRETEVTRYALRVGSGVAGTCDLYLGHGLALTLRGELRPAQGPGAQVSLVWYLTEGIALSLSADLRDGLTFGWLLAL